MKENKKRCGGGWLIALIAVAMAAALGGVSCSSGNRADGGRTITFAFQDRVADAASLIAVKKGFFAAEGLDVRPMIFSSGPSCTEALIYGNADFGTMGDTTAIITTSKGRGFTIIASHSGGEHRHRLLVANHSRITTISELEGKRIGVKKGTSTHGGLLLLARQGGLELSDEIIDLAPNDQLLALATGELDAIVASEPTPSKAIADGFGRELTTLGGLGNTYPIFVLVNSKFAASHPDLVDRMIKGLSRATAFIKEYPDEAVAILAAQSGLAPGVIRSAMAYHHYGLNLDDSVQDSLAVTARFLKDIGRIDRMPAWDVVIDRRYLP